MQPESGEILPRSTSENVDLWLAWHLFFSGDRALLLTELVAPLLRELRAQGLISGYFFVRYALYGPHVRLRLRTNASSALLGARIESAAAAFFSEHRSSAVSTPERQTEIDQALLAADPNELPGPPRADCSVEAAAFVPEIARYGGQACLESNLKVFQASSELALSLLIKHRGRSREAQLPVQLESLAFTARCLAGEEPILAEVLAWGTTFFGPKYEGVMQRADAVFEKRPQVFRSLIEISAGKVEEEARLGLEAAGRELQSALAFLSYEARTRVQLSQMHMMANRLGLDNANEVYASRLLRRAIDETVELGGSF